jgi:hypothetical protein
METEYTTSTGYKVFYGILAFLAVAIAFFLVTKSSDSTNALEMIIPALMVGLGMLVVINLIKRKVIITDSDIRYTWVFKNTSLAFSEIKGYRLLDKKIILIEAQQAGKSIRIGNYDSLEDSDGLTAWIIGNFTDLDKSDLEEDKRQILQDSSLGVTEQERERKLNNSRRMAMFYSIAGTVMFFVAQISMGNVSDKNFKFLLQGILLVYPVIGILLMGISNGLILLYSKKNSAHASVFLGLFSPSLALVITSFLGYHVIDAHQLIIPAVVVGAVIFIITCFLGVKRTNPSFITHVIIALLFSAAYGLGSTTSLNCVFDQSEPKVYNSTITLQYISHGSKSTSYYLYLSEWGPDHLKERISVSKSFYSQVALGSVVKVNLKRGTLSIPWFYVEQ